MNNNEPRLSFRAAIALAVLAGLALFGACSTTMGTDGAAGAPAAAGTSAAAPATGRADAADSAGSASQSEPLLWRIGGTTPSWLFGTIHLPDERVLDLPEPVLDAFAASDVLATEIPLTPETVQAMSSAAFLEGEQTLRDVLPQELYERTDAYLSSRGLPLAMLERLKLWALTTQLATLDYIVELATKQPLDLHLWSMGEEQGKRLAGLETLEEQIAVFESLTLDEQIELHRQTLDLLEQAGREGRSPARELVDAYVSGDTSELMTKMRESLDESSPVSRKFTTKLLGDRNRLMAERIAARIAAEPGTSFFFAVGAGHVPGDDGIVALLAREGLAVTRVTGAYAAAVGN